MFHIDASQLDHRQLNEQLRHSSGALLITGCLGQRFIGAGADDLTEISHYVRKYCALFGGDRDAIMDAPFTVITPDTKNPYRQMYVLN